MFTAGSNGGRAAAAVASAVASAVRGGGRKGAEAIAQGGSEAEREVDEVVHILSPGPLAQSAHPPTRDELAAAAETVRAAKRAWRDGMDARR